MNSKMDVYLAAALAKGDAKTKISFLFRAAAGFDPDAATKTGIDIGSRPGSGKIPGIYTASGTPDSIKALSLNNSVISLSGSQQMR